MTIPPIPPVPPILPAPLPDDDRVGADGATGPGIDEMATMEHDGERVIDPDIDAAQVDSAEADRLASGASAENEGDR